MYLLLGLSFTSDRRETPFRMDLNVIWVNPL